MTAGTPGLVIAGAALAGVRAAEAAREAGFGGRLTIVGAGPNFPPYDRPPLSKRLSADDPDALTRIRVREDLDAELLLGTRATGLDVARRQVRLDDGSSRDYAGLVIATGAAPRTLPGAEGNVIVLRTVRDRARLAESLHSPDRGRPATVAVIGAGVLGCEITAACREAGADVALIDVSPEPMTRVVGTEMGRVLSDLHARQGVRLLLGRGVRSVRRSGAATVVALDDGPEGGLEIAADVVVVCIGVVPNTSWLAGSGLTVDDGVVCDQWCFAEGTGQTVVAAGDVARWHHPLLGRQVRVEHWTNAAAQGGAAARNLLAAVAGTGEPVRYDALPYSWSDQYGWKLQMLGLPAGDAKIVEGNVEEGTFVTAYVADGRLTGALCVNSPARLRHWRQAVTSAAAGA